ncbi:YggS family pyridoxal phosphate-dependent enzyme [Lacihabitans lacunae]|uniref:Pyridoxal phosphate homeostasis protein n=1 Tax=Lacihabitans lacunae TaxID=1028214 RepID=A0ABV7YW80_9BACT
MSIQQNILKISEQLPEGVQLVAVSKFKPVEMLMEAYEAGFKVFGENYVQELVEKYEQMPKDIKWNFIGHLQSNKVKYIAPFVSLIHSVDSFKLLKEINKQAEKNERVIDCLLQVYIAQEDTKTGIDEAELFELLKSEAFLSLKNIRIVGLMGMSTFTENMDQVKTEFKSLKTIFDKIREENIGDLGADFKEISMGMSGDWPLAVAEGSTMIRVGSAIFGNR